MWGMGGGCGAGSGNSVHSQRPPSPRRQSGALHVEHCRISLPIGDGDVNGDGSTLTVGNAAPISGHLPRRSLLATAGQSGDQRIEASGLRRWPVPVVDVVSSDFAIHTLRYIQDWSGGVYPEESYRRVVIPSGFGRWRIPQSRSVPSITFIDGSDRDGPTLTVGPTHIHPSTGHQSGDTGPTHIHPSTARQGGAQHVGLYRTSLPIGNGDGKTLGTTLHQAPGDRDGLRTDAVQFGTGVNDKAGFYTVAGIGFAKGP